MTLTGSLAAPLQNDVLALLSARFEQVLVAKTLRIDRIAICRQDSQATPFRVIADFALQ